jgi:hypothetical protein
MPRNLAHKEVKTYLAILPWAIQVWLKANRR